ncbi:putative carboxylesterase [Rosa chinensis]|uniref:Putative carboxylesterase n=1 Tax=Rosa chinensis TaxID=74649 RepID=A0A2P6PF09_ROSCH|nr:putative carboxylesterase [Rosa chinensis]
MVLVQNNYSAGGKYSKPLIDYLQNLPENEKVTSCVILVGHSSGGACVSYALEHFPQKILKAIFICATMVSNDQRPSDVFAEDFMIHGNGKDQPPTGFMFEKEQMKGLYFNQSPAKVCRN